MELLFERFLSEERGEWPDIDLDLPSGDRREQVIQYVYQRYGTRGAAMTANVITYRGRSAAREVGQGARLRRRREVDRLAKLMNQFEWRDPNETLAAQPARRRPRPATTRAIRQFAALWARIQDLPRHLGQHSGGMVICQGRLDEVVPLEPATMPGRVVVQWDKDDCADLGIVKVDLLGLGMMAVLAGRDRARQRAVTTWRRRSISRTCRPTIPHVYRMLQAADTIGVFQVESRAQMATLPRLQADAASTTSSSRSRSSGPGPIVGQMVHPYLAPARGRRAGRPIRIRRSSRS